MPRLVKIQIKITNEKGRGHWKEAVYLDISTENYPVGKMQSMGIVSRIYPKLDPTNIRQRHRAAENRLLRRTMSAKI